MKISICIATYNGEKYIKEQLMSILHQIGVNDEVIISDDSSGDDTVAIIKSIQDDRIYLYENQKFKSPTFNFENALKYATGDYIYLSDQDDIWYDGKVDKIQKLFLKYDLVLSDACIINFNNKIINKSFFKLNNSKKGFLQNLYKNSYIGCAMAFNRVILEKSMPFPKDIPMHDWWIGLNAELYGKVYFLNEQLIGYRRHDSNASPTGEKSKYSTMRKISFRIRLIKNLILRYK